MDNKNIYADLDIGSGPSSKPGPKLPGGKGKDLTKFVLIAAGVFVFLLVMILIITMASGGQGTKNQSKTSQSNPGEFDPKTEALKSFALRFITKFYWYNKDSFLDTRRELEQMMTSDCLEKYKRVYYEPEFENLILDSSIIVKFDADRVLSNTSSGSNLVKIMGYITYENGKTGNYIRTAATWMFNIVETDGQLQIKDFEIYK